MFGRAVAGAFLAMLSFSAHADTKTFLGLRLACTGGSPATVARSSELIYYDFSGQTKSQQYTLCLRAGGAWGGQRHGSAATSFMEPCEHFDLAAFTLACRGGAISAVALTTAIRGMLRSSSNGQNVKLYPVQGDTIFIPFYSPPRSVQVPSPPINAGGIMVGTIPTLKTIPPQVIASLPLPSGYGIANDWQGFSAGTISINWDTARGIPFMPVSGSPPAIVPHVEPAAAWVRFLSAIFPWGQGAVAIGVIAFAMVAHAGFGHGLGNPDEGKKLRLVLFAFAALVALALSGIPGTMPESALQQARQQLDAARSQVAAIERDRAMLASIFRASNGMAQPIAQSDVQRVNMLTQVHRIDPVSNPQVNPEVWATLFLLPCLLLLAFYHPRFISGWDWIFRKHPAEPVIVPALQSGSAINAHALADVLTPDARDLDLRKPSFRHAHDAEKASALKEKLDADAELADAAIRREQKRAELRRKRAEITRLERELGE